MDFFHTSQALRREFRAHKSDVKRRAKGFLKHDYLVPAGPYEEQWDWDAFFIGVALLSDVPSEAVFLKNWALNYLEHVNAKTCFTPGLLTPKGIDTRLNHIKPFLAQGIYIAARALANFSWIQSHFATLQKSIAYREKHLLSQKYGLCMWYDSMESGADNNVAALDFPKGTVVGTDLNTFLYREYQAMAKIARALGKVRNTAIWTKKAQQLKRNINKYLWNAQDATYYNLDSRTGQHIKRHSYSNVLPLWCGLATPAAGKKMIKKYVLNPQKLWAKHGIRTLAKDDPEYNNRNMIKPHSNWQGPVWPIANYLYIHGLLNYGFVREARVAAQRVMENCLRDIAASGGMHENYHADTGKALAAPNFVSWKLLLGLLAEDITAVRNPFRL